MIPPRPNALAALEDFLLRGEIPWAEIEQLAPPEELGRLFHLCLARLMRRGPGSMPAPAQLLATARAGARRGALPIATASELRQILDDLEDEVRQAGAWSPEAALWWDPLPPEGGLEDLWESLLRGPTGALTPPSSAELASALGGEGAGWLLVPELLAPAWLEGLWTELEKAHAGGLLDLERAGVGAREEKVAARSDSVVYLSGLEPELLADGAAPRLALLVQALRGPFAAWVGRVLPRRHLRPPQRAMLARYPAPSAGYNPHLDNPARCPGEENDNGRALTFVLYLNPLGREPDGGEIALWPEGGRVSAEPAAVLAPKGGAAALFDSRRVPHQVRPVGEGEARWALSLWFQERPPGEGSGERSVPARESAVPSDESAAPSRESGAASAVTPRKSRPALPVLRANDALLPLESPPLPAATTLFHDLGSAKPAGRILSIQRGPSGGRRLRAAVVSTVYRGGEALLGWCRHHLELGFDHILLIFDRLEEAEEQATARRLGEELGSERLTLWSGARLAEERWPSLLADPELLDLYPVARAWEGSSWSIAARQTLNATAGLAAARDGELGGEPIDWLLHLDGDERLLLSGQGRGGATVREHFEAAARAGVRRIRYLNHELLREGSTDLSRRYKVNPNLAASRLGPVGWAQLVRHLKMAPTDPRPYFLGYTNGKSAVSVAHGASAGGVHGWNLLRPVAPEADLVLAGPFVLHDHPPAAEGFAEKYLRRASAPERDAESQPFRPSPVEEAALSTVHRMRGVGADEQAIRDRLHSLHERLTTFGHGELELLEEAGLVLEAREPRKPA